MIGSICLYLVVLTGCLLLAYRAQETNKSLWVWIVVMCLSLIVGLRGYTVGVDTDNYVEIFQNVAAGNSEAVQGTERTFLLIVRILQLFSKSHTFLFLIFSFVTNALMIFRIWEFRNIISFPWAIIYFFGCFFFFTFNIMRQMVAVAMIFWGTRYVQRKIYWKFLLIMAVAALFHQSALLGLLYLVIDVLCFKKTRQIYIDLIKNIVKDSKIVAAIGLCLGLLAVVFVAIKASKYIHYFTNVTLDVGFLVPLKLLVLCAFACMVKHESGKWGGIGRKAIQRYMDQNVVIYYGVGLCISLLGYSFHFMDRIGLYFTPFGCLFVGYLIKKARHRWIALAVLGVVVILPLAMDLCSGGQGQLPYMFFWQ